MSSEVDHRFLFSLVPSLYSKETFRNRFRFFKLHTVSAQDPYHGTSPRYASQVPQWGIQRTDLQHGPWPYPSKPPCPSIRGGKGLPRSVRKEPCSMSASGNVLQTGGSVFI